MKSFKISLLSTKVLKGSLELCGIYDILHENDKEPERHISVSLNVRLSFLNSKLSNC